MKRYEIIADLKERIEEAYRDEERHKERHTSYYHTGKAVGLEIALKLLEIEDDEWRVDKSF